MSKLMIINVLIVAALAGAEPGLAVGDAYLKMLDSEAEGLELDQRGLLQAQQNEKPTRYDLQEAFDWDTALDDDSLPQGLERDAFDTMLHQNFYGTYQYFKKLNSADEQTVYDRYTKADSTNLENVRKDILDLLKR